MRAPGTWTLEELFAGRPAALELFHAIRQYIGSLGPVTMEVMKTQVSFGAETKFAWVWLPQLWIKKQPDESVVLTFDLRRRIDDRRIKQSVEPRPGRFTHHVVVRKESDLDRDLRDWIREAYEQHTLFVVRGSGGYNPIPCGRACPGSSRHKNSDIQDRSWLWFYKVHRPTPPKPSGFLDILFVSF